MLIVRWTSLPLFLVSVVFIGGGGVFPIAVTVGTTVMVVLVKIIRLLVSIVFIGGGGVSPTIVTIGTTVMVVLVKINRFYIKVW